MKLSATFQAWLDEVDLSDKEAAELLDTSPVTIWRLRTGKQWPSRELAQRIATESKGKVSLEGMAFADTKDAA